MIWICEVEYGIAQYDKELFILANKDPGEWVVLSLDDDSLS